MRDLRALKKDSWKFYKKWRETGSYSPALNAHVRVTRRGWNHIVGYSKSVKRSNCEISRRIKSLKKARKVLETSNQIKR